MNLNRQKPDIRQNSRTIYIAGAGLSGLSAAITLLKNGYDVIVYEKKQKNDTKKLDAHGIMNYLQGDVSNSSLNDLLTRFDLKLNYVHTYFKIIRYGPSPNLKKIEVMNYGKPVAFSIERGSHSESAEEQFRAQATKQGCDIRYKEKPPLLSVDIIATGNFSKNIIGVGSVLEDCSLDENTILITNDPKYSPGGYFYMLPLGKGKVVAVNTCFFNYTSQQLRKKFYQILQEIPPIHELTRNSSESHKFVGFGSVGRRKSAIWKGKLIIGEAGGFLDALWGFGTLNAIRSGYLAAMSIIKGINFDRLWKQEMGKELYTSHLLRVLRDRVTSNQLIEKFEKEPSSVSLKQFLDKRTKNDHWSYKRNILARTLLFLKEKKNTK